MSKLVILGIDALSYPLVKHGGKQWQHLACMNPKRFIHANPVSGPAWTTIMTGWPSEKHGINAAWGFVYEEGHKDCLITPAPYFWERLPLSVGLINVPTLYRPLAMPNNGWMVTGWPRAQPETYPPEIKSLLPDNYRVDIDGSMNVICDADLEDLEARYRTLIWPRLQAARLIYNRYPVDVLFIVWTYLDRVGHTFGKEHPVVRNARLNRAYGAIDTLILRACWALFGFEKLVVVSDHGWLDDDHDFIGCVGGINIDLKDLKRDVDFVPWIYRELGLGEPDLSPMTDLPRQVIGDEVAADEQAIIEQRLRGLGYIE